MGKELGPLEKVTKDADVLRKQVDKIVKESVKNAGNKKLKDKEIKLKANFKSCYDLKPQVTELLQRATDLSEENETGKVKNFETKKKKEVDRITAWQNQIEDAMTKLLPDDEREAYLKELKGEDADDEEEDDDEEDEEDEEEEEDSKEETSEQKKEDGEEGEEEDEEEDEDEEDEGEETMETPKKDVEKLKLKKDEDDEEEEVEEEIEEEEVEEEETEEEEEEEEEETKAKESKKTAKAKKDDDEEDEEEEEEDEEDDDDEEEDDDEDDEKEETKGEDDLEVTTSGQMFEALYDYAGEEKGDLAFKKGEILTILDTREDGWWEAENDKGDKGNVPSTYLKMFNKYKDVQKDDEDEEDEEEAEDEEEEDGEEDGKPKDKKLKKQRSGKDLWKGVRKAVKETSVTDVLHALGAVPSGFRISTLGKLFNTDRNYTMKNYLTPKLSPSNFIYRDTFFDPAENKIRHKICREQRIVTLVNCRQIPVPGGGLEVTSRHVRMCLFDGQNVLSNIHTVKVASVDKEQRAWSFNTRVGDLMDTYQHAEMFLRSNMSHPNIGILFELCASYLRTKTKEKGEFSCGWAHLPLEDKETGLPIHNRSYDLFVNGGTPYEKGVEVDPSISRRTSTNAFMSLISGNKQPRLTVKLSVPKREQKEMLDQLPETLLGNLSLLQMYSFHRQILADTLLRDRLDLESTDLIHSPCLVTFPIIADQHDMMKLLRDTWVEKVRGVRKAEMRDAEFMKDLFKTVIMESVYPLLNSASLPSYRSGDMDVEEKRQAEIARFRQDKLAKRGILALLLSADMSHQPVDMKEFSYNVIGPNCLVQHHPVPEVSVEG